MDARESMEERLWNYIDQNSGIGEQEAIEELLAENREWQNKYRALLQIHQLMNSADLEAPSLRFTKNVMEDIAKYQVAPATGSYLNKKIIWSIAGFFIILFSGFFIYSLAQMDWSSPGQSSQLLPQFHLPVKWEPAKIFNNAYTSVFMMINVVLALVLLDMYLQRKKDAPKQSGV